MDFHFDNSYARLPARFYARLPPAPVPEPRLLRLNHGLARRLGLDADALDSPQGARLLSGQTLPEGAEPLAMAYAGHQFGGWVPQLGDGRAILLGEIIAPDGKRFDLHLKGAGRTPFSRGGDGKAALGPALREYIVSEAMHALGIPTTRALAVIATGEQVMRETPQPGAILVRVASSHIRVGTFQYFLGRRDHEALQILLEHAIARHASEAAQAENPPLAFLRHVVEAQAALVAQWMQVGFIHGVMNTDNMAVSGETIDYGPCAFMDDYHPETVFSSIDRMGRYAWGNQPPIAHWNLAQLAQCLLPLMPGERESALRAAQDAIDRFSDHFQAEWNRRMGAKLGFSDANAEQAGLTRDLLEIMADDGIDYTLAFRRLTQGLQRRDFAEFDSLFTSRERVASWRARWLAQLAEPAAAAEVMARANPVRIPRNHRVEQAIEAALQGDMAPFERLIATLATPFAEQPGAEEYEFPPAPGERVLATYCGT